MLSIKKILPFIFFFNTVISFSLYPALAQADSLIEYYQNVRSKQTELPSKAEFLLAEKLFRRLFVGESGPKLRRQWATLGFELTGTISGRDPLLILQEIGEGSTQNTYTGKGFFVFSLNLDSQTILQSSHSFSDTDMAEITFKLMSHHNIRAAAWNTAPATKTPHDYLLFQHAPGGRENYLLAFSKAMLTVLPNSHLVQLHSFEQASMYSTTGKHADIILSSYGKQMNQSTSLISRCIKNTFEYNVRNFPFEIQEMGAATGIAGATYNATGDFMHKADSQAFTHISMSDLFRKEFLNNADIQQKLYVCLSKE